MLRILDANLNRIGEGLRLLEDVSRFVLNDADLCRQLKSMRHDLLPRDSMLQTRLLAARNAREDVAAFAEVPGESQRRDIASLVSANSRRVQQSLRVLEELGKIQELAPGLDWQKVKQCRFALYELEQTMVSRLMRRDSAKRMEGLYLVLDTQALKGRSPVEVSRQAISGGVRAIQLRDKQMEKRDLISLGKELQALCSASGVLFIMNDFLDASLACGADGLHVGQHDLPLPQARKLLPPDKIVGTSNALFSEAVKSQEDGADYVAVGAIFPTLSKPGTRLAGLDTLRKVRKEVAAPIVAIGGINESNVAEVVAAGADAVAVINAVLGAEDVREASHRLSSRFKESRESTK